MWAANVAVHPNLALAIRALKAAVDLPRSNMLKAAVRCHAARLQLVAAWDSTGCLRIGPCADADQRVVRAATKASDDRSGFFCRASTAGGHALRSAARATALSFANCSPSKKRQDQEGLEDADVEITFTSTWTQWVKTLDVENRLWLRVWRGGAIRTPSRRHRGEAGLQSCPYCAFPHASARHFWQNCQHFAAFRAELEAEFDIPSCWWQAQPRCTSKSGWVVYQADGDLKKRARLQIAACRLGIAIVAADTAAVKQPAPQDYFAGGGAKTISQNSNQTSLLGRCYFRVPVMWSVNIEFIVSDSCFVFHSINCSLMYLTLFCALTGRSLLPHPGIRRFVARHAFLAFGVWSLLRLQFGLTRISADVSKAVVGLCRTSYMILLCGIVVISQTLRKSICRSIVW